MKNCIHSEYWTAHYGTCMACRAENAESKLSEANRRVEELDGLYQQSVETIHEQAKHSHEQRTEIEIIKSANEFLSKCVDDRRQDIERLEKANVDLVLARRKAHDKIEKMKEVVRVADDWANKPYYLCLDRLREALTALRVTEGNTNSEGV